MSRSEIDGDFFDNLGLPFPSRDGIYGMKILDEIHRRCSFSDESEKMKGLIHRLLQELLRPETPDRQATVLATLLELQAYPTEHPLTLSFNRLSPQPDMTWAAHYCLYLMKEGQLPPDYGFKDEKYSFLSHSDMFLQMLIPEWNPAFSLPGLNWQQTEFIREIIHVGWEKQKHLHLKGFMENAIAMMYRFLSQALIYYDGLHSYTYADPDKVSAWLELMVKSQYFSQLMGLVTLYTQLTSSYVAPPTVMFSKTFDTINYNELMEHHRNKGDKGVRSYLTPELVARLLLDLSAIRTTGFGRNQGLACEIVRATLMIGEDPTIRDWLRGHLGDNVSLGKLSILNLGSGLVQTPELYQLLRASGAQAQIASVDIYPLELLAQLTKPFSYQNMSEGLPSAEPEMLFGERLLEVLKEMYPYFTNLFFRHDLRLPFDEGELKQYLLNSPPNVVVATNSAHPHLDYEGKRDLFEEVLRVLPPGVSVIHVGGGYIGSSEIVRGLTCIAAVGENGQIALRPVTLTVSDGWRSEFGNTTIQLSKGEKIPKINLDSKAAYHMTDIVYNVLAEPYRGSLASDLRLCRRSKALLGELERWIKSGAGNGRLVPYFNASPTSRHYDCIYEDLWGTRVKPE